MPELPEVEVTKLGVTPHLHQQTIDAVVIRQHQLRWPVSEGILSLVGQKITHISRRAKYLLLHTPEGTIMIHLGMSGSLQVLEQFEEPSKHDHIDLILKNGTLLRYNDPRKFGSWLYLSNEEANNHQHQLLKSLGPEPLTEAFNAELLWQASRKRRVAVKNFIMDNKIVVGVGNIYANEALFSSAIHPLTPVNCIDLPQWEQLVQHIKVILSKAIEQGGTTLKDFNQVDGKLGYFAQELKIYGRAGKPCPICNTAIQSVVLGQRNSFYCEQCQMLAD